MRLSCLLLLLSLYRVGATKPRAKQSETLSDKSFSQDESCVLLESCRYCSFSEMKKIPQCQLTKYVSIDKCWKNNQQDSNDKYIYLNYKVCAGAGVSPEGGFLLGVLVLLGLSVLLFRREKSRVEEEFIKKVMGKNQL